MLDRPILVLLPVLAGFNFGRKLPNVRSCSTKPEVTMATLDRIDALRRQHSTLEHRLDDETHRPHPDDAVLAELKRQKLRIKDEINQLARHA